MGNLPPWLQPNTNNNNPSQDAIKRRLGKKKKKTSKKDTDAKTDAQEKKTGLSKSDPDYAEDMAGQ